MGERISRLREWISERISRLREWISERISRLWEAIESDSQAGSESNWSRVLLAFYRQPAGRITQHNLAHRVPESHKLCEETGLSPEEINKSLQYLIEDAELIRVGTNSPQEDREYVLTKEGFSVAHQLVKDNRRETQNAMLVGFTLVLAISSVLQTLTSISSFSGATSSFLYGMLVITTIAIALLVWLYPQAFNNAISR